MSEITAFVYCNLDSSAVVVELIARWEKLVRDFSVDSEKGVDSVWWLRESSSLLEVLTDIPSEYFLWKIQGIWKFLCWDSLIMRISLSEVNDVYSWKFKTLNTWVITRFTRILHLKVDVVLSRSHSFSFFLSQQNFSHFSSSISTNNPCQHVLHIPIISHMVLLQLFLMLVIFSCRS